MTNIENVRRYFKAWTDRDADAILSSLVVGGTYQDPATVMPISGEALRTYVNGLWQAFPDLTFEEESIGETGPNRVAAQWMMRGTNAGSMMGLPPTGKAVTLRGADFFTLRDDKVETVTGYFDSRELPRQIGLDVIVQPAQVGPFRFGTSTMVQTGKTQEPAAFSITYLEARDDDAVKTVRDGSRLSLLDMLEMDGFIAATTATIGHRMVTISAWDSPDASRQVMKQGTPLQGDEGLLRRLRGKLWLHQRMDQAQAVFVRCDSCGRMNREPAGNRLCSCSAQLPEPAPYW